MKTKNYYIDVIQGISLSVSIIGIIIFSIIGNISLTIGLGFWLIFLVLWLIFLVLDYHLKNISNSILKIR